MFRSRINFSTSDNAQLSWTDSYEGISSDELEKLKIECQTAVHSLDAELSDRKSQIDPAFERDIGSDRALLNSSLNRGRLLGTEVENHDGADRFLRALKDGLTEPPDSTRGDRIYGHSLYLLSKVAGPAYVLLVICSLGKNRVQRMSPRRRVNLIRYIKQHEDLLYSPFFKSKAEESSLHQTGGCHFPSLIFQLTFVDLCVDPVPRTESKKRKYDGIEDTSAVTSDRNTSPSIRSHSRQLEQEPGENTTLLDSTRQRGLEDMAESESISTDEIPTPDIDNNYNISSTHPYKVDSETTCYPQRDPAIYQQSIPWSSNQLHNGNRHVTEGIAFTAPELPKYLSEDAELNLEASSSTHRLAPSTLSLHSYSNSTLELYKTKFDYLDPDSKELATILVFLGRADVPESMLLRGCQPRKFWNPAGEVDEAIMSELVAVFKDADRLQSAVKCLERQALITSKSGSLSERILSLDSNFRLHIEKHSSDSVTWKVQATRLVFHTFPKDKDIEPYL
jgi:hypothetical protein